MLLAAGLYSHLPPASKSVPLQTLLFPDLGFPSSVSTLGIASDGMTTFVYFEPDPEASTTLIGTDLPS